MKRQERIERVKKELNGTYQNRDNYLKWLNTPLKIKDELRYLNRRLTDKNDILTQAILEMKLYDVKKLEEKYWSLNDLYK